MAKRESTRGLEWSTAPYKTKANTFLWTLILLRDKQLPAQLKLQNSFRKYIIPSLYVIILSPCMIPASLSSTLQLPWCATFFFFRKPSRFVKAHLRPALLPYPIILPLLLIHIRYGSVIAAAFFMWNMYFLFLFYFIT